MNWTILFVNEVAKAELDALPIDMRARFERIVTLIRDHGLEKVREPYVKHLDLRHGVRPPGVHSADLRQEEPENASK